MERADTYRFKKLLRSGMRSNVPLQKELCLILNLRAINISLLTERILLPDLARELHLLWKVAGRFDG